MDFCRAHVSHKVGAQSILRTLTTCTHTTHTQTPLPNEGGVDAANEGGVDAANEGGVDAANEGGVDAANEGGVDAAAVRTI